MKPYHDLMCCPKCGNIDVLERVWMYLNETIEVEEEDREIRKYKCPQCGEISEVVYLDDYVEDKVEELLLKDRIFIYEQPDYIDPENYTPSLWCAFKDYDLLREVWSACSDEIEFYRLGTEGLVESEDDLEESIGRGCTIGFQIDARTNRSRHCIPAIAEKIHIAFVCC